MRRLRPLSEAECYTRLYGDGEPTVRVIRAPSGASHAAMPSGESLRRLFEARFDAREADPPQSEAA